MAKEFYTILTTAGKEKILRATVSSKLEIKEFAVGDGQGRYYEPNQDQSTLVSEKYRGNVNAVSLDGSSITIECLVPATVGGFSIRELGIYDKENTLLLISKYPLTQKPATGSGSEKDLHIKVIVELDNAENVAIIADMNTVIATMGNVKNELKNYYKKQEVDEKIEGFNSVEVVDSLESADASKALSANQGKQLKRLIEAIPTIEIVDNLQTNNSQKVLSAAQGVVIAEKLRESGIQIEELESLKDSIQLTTDAEFVNSLINNTAKPGSVLLFSNIGEKNGNVTGEGYTLYTGLENCNRYSGCNIMIKTMDGVERNLHPKYFQVPAYFIAKVDKQNTKRVVIYPFGGGNTDEIKSRLDNVEAKVEQAFTQAGEGKKAIVNAFTGLGISASPSETFQSLADKIKNKALSKEKIANALTNKGILTDTNASVEQIVSNIRGIEVLKRSLISYSIINHSYSATFPQYWLQYVGSNRTHDSYGVCVYKILRPFRKAILNMVVVGANSAYDPQYYIGFSRSYDELINNISDGIERPKNIQNHFSLKAINYEGNSGEVAYWFSEEVSFETSMTNLAVYGYSHRYSGSEKALQAYVGTVIILE